MGGGGGNGGGEVKKKKGRWGGPIRGMESCYLRANERPRKKLHLMAQTDRQTSGHANSMTKFAQWGQFSENYMW